MKEVFEKIVERLKHPDNYTIVAGKHFTTVERAIEIVNQVAGEYSHRNHDLVFGVSHRNDGWIPFEEEEPPHSDEFLLVQCNGRHRNIVFSNALELASYTESGWCFSAYPEWDNAEVIAWRELPPAYQPKGE